MPDMNVRLSCLFLFAQLALAQGSLTLVADEIKILGTNFTDTGGDFKAQFDAGAIAFSLDYSGRSGSGRFRIEPPAAPTGLNLGNIIRLQPAGTFRVAAERSGNISVRTTIKGSGASADAGCLAISLADYPCVLTTLDVESASNRAYIDATVSISNGSFPSVTRSVDTRVYFRLSAACPAEPLLTDSRLFLPPRVDCAPCAAVAVDHLEIVQVVQTVANEIPMVTGKPTVARLFLKFVDPPQQPVSGVKAVLRAFREGVELAGSPIASWNGSGGGFTVLNVMRRDNEDHSINFELPTEWLAEGKLMLTAEIKVPPCTGGLTRPENLTAEATPEFSTFLPKDRSSFRVAWVPVCYKNATTCPKDADIAQYDYLMRHLFPLAPDAITYDRLNIPPLPPYEQPLEDGPVIFVSEFRRLRFMSYLRRLKMAGEGRYYDQLLGVLPRIQGFGLAGKAEKPGEVALIAQVSVTPSSFPLNDAFHPIHYNANSVAHEVAHNYNRSHTNEKTCTPVNGSSGDIDPFTDWPYSTADLQEPGFDVVVRKVFPATWGDLMSYCSNKGIGEGMSPHTYKSMMATRFDLRPPRLLNAEAAPAPRTASAAPRASAAKQAILTGWARKDGTEAVIDPVYQVLSEDEPPTASTTGSHCLEFSGPGGELAKHCFDLSFVEPEFGTELDAQQFAFKLPLPDGTTKLALTASGAELTALRAATAPISLSINAPAQGDRWMGGPQTIAWTGSAPDGLTLTYTVQYSSDGGKSWLPMALDIQATRYTFDPAFIEGGADVHFRVLAAAELSAATADVGPIDVRQAASLRASVTTLDFGAVPDRGMAERAFIIENTGSGPLVLSAMTIDNPAFRLSGAPAPITIAAGAERAITVRFAPAASGVTTGVLKIAANDPTRPTLEVGLGGIAGDAPVIAVSPTTLDFGTVNAGQSRDLTVTVRNTGTAALTVSSISSSNARFASTVTTPLTLAPAASQSVVIRFSPAGAGAQSGTMTIANNDSARPSVSVAVAGTGAAVPSIDASPAALDFGNVAVGQSKDLTLTIRNTGTASLTVSAVTSLNPRFTATPAAPFNIGAGSSQTVTARFTPSAAGAQTGSLTLSSSDPARPTVTVALSGTGTAVADSDQGLLKVDDGSFEYLIGLAAGSQAYFVNRLTPPIYPATLRKVLIAFPRPQDGGLPTGAAIQVVTAVAGSTSPPSLSGGTLTRITGAVTAFDTFVEYDVPPLTISSGSFIVGFTVVNPPGAYPAYLDESPSQQRSYVSNDGATFYLIDTIPTIGAGNFAIRARIDGAAGPSIDVTPAALDFGSVAVGQSKELMITIRNSGSAMLTISFLSSTNARFVPAGSAPISLTIGASATLAVRFTPTTAGAQTGTLTLSSNDPVRPSATVALDGSGAPPPAACVTSPTGLVSWWAADGNSSDAVGGNAGMLQGGATFAAGQTGQSFNLNGTSGYVQVGSPANLRLTSGITIEGWVFPRSLRTQTAGPPMGAILTKWAQVASDTSDSDSYGLWLIQDAGAVKLFSAIHQPGREPTLQGGSVPLNAWSHVAMTFDAASGQYSLYVNGQAVAFANSPGAIFTGNRNVQIGREDSYIGRVFDGLIDEVAVYGRALTALQMQTIYAAGSIGKCK